MHPKPKLLPMAFLTCMALANTSAFAGTPSSGVPGSAAWSGLVFTLEDLNPSDGLSPSLTFAEHQYQRSCDIVINCFNYPFEPVTDGFQSLTSGGLSYWALVADAVVSPGPGFVIGWDIMRFGLSPDTRLTISGMVAAQGGVVSEDFTYGGDYWRGVARSWGAAQVTLGDQSVLATTSGQPGFDEQSFAFVVDSSIGDAQTYELRFDLGAYGRASIAPIPEPSTYGLMLAGLAAVGWVTRRSRK